MRWLRFAAEAALVAVLLLVARVLPGRVLRMLGDWTGRLGSRRGCLLRATPTPRGLGGSARAFFYS